MTTMADVAALKSSADATFKNKEWMAAAEAYSATIEARKAASEENNVGEAEVPQLFVLYNNRSAAYNNARFASLAVKDAEASLALDSSSKNGRGLQRLGNAYKTLGQLAESKAAYQKFLAIDPGNTATKDIIREVDGFAQAKEQMNKNDKKVIQETTDVRKNEKDPFGSGDQSDCPGKLPQSEMPGGSAFKLRRVWAAGGDYNPLGDYSTHSDFLYHCHAGHPKEVQFLIDRVEDDEEALKQLVNRRESILRLSPLMAAIAGTRKPRPAECGDGKGNLEVCKILLTNGADPDAQDIAGYSVVHHATTAYASDLTVQILPILFARNATFQRFNRFGDSALAEPVMANNISAVRGLLQFGTDPLKASKSGEIDLSRLALGKPDIVKLLQTAQGFRCLKAGDSVTLQPPVEVKAVGGRTVKATRGIIDSVSVGEYRVGVEAGGGNSELTYVMVRCEDLLRESKSDRACAQCGKDGAINQCSVCKVPKYCDYACQKAHWKAGHKKECQVASEWTIKPPPLKAESRYQVDALNPGKPIDSHKQIKKMMGKSVKDLVVKIQVPMDPTIMGMRLATRGGERGPILIYDKGQRHVNWYIGPDDCACYDEVVKAVKTTGVQGAKQYFRAELVDGDLKVVKSGLGMQTW